MSRTPPPNLRSLEVRIRNLAREEELPEGCVRRLIGIVVVGQLLARTEAAAIKGASNLEIRIGTRRSRVSSDLDTVRRHSLDVFREQLAEALREGWGAFTGTLMDDGEIPTPAPDGYRPHRFRAKLQFRCTFGFPTRVQEFTDHGNLLSVRFLCTSGRRPTCVTLRAVGEAS